MTPHEFRKAVLYRYSYDPNTGIMRRHETSEIVGAPSKKGYLRLSFLGKTYSIHRLAYLIMEGEWPDQVDHENRIRDDNRWVNLRPSSQLKNAQNHNVRVTNKSGTSGVCWGHQHKWVASLMRDGKRKKIRGCATIEDAIEARRRMLVDHANGNW